MCGHAITKTTLTTDGVKLLPGMINEVKKLAKSPSKHAGKRYDHLDPDAEYQELVDNLQTVLKQRFLTAYGYPYNGADSLPLFLVQGKSVSTHADFVNTSTQTTDPLTAYVDTTVVDKTVPIFCAGQFKNELIAFLRTLLVDEETSYKVQQFHATYADLTSHSRYSVDSVMCFAVKDIDQGSGPEPYLFLSYIGVHYPSTPQADGFLAPHPVPLFYWLCGSILQLLRF